MRPDTVARVSRPRLRLPQRRQPGSAGFSLVELMIGLAIGLLLVAGITLLFAKSSQTGNELEKSIRQIENGRFAVETLRDELRHAGYYAEVPADALGYTSPAVCATVLTELGWDKSSPAEPRLPLPIVGLTATEAHALPCLVNHKEGTPAFAVRRLSVDTIAPTAVAGDRAFVQTSRCSTDPLADPFIVSATAADFVLRTLRCDAANAVRQYVSRVYYIADCSECGRDSIPTLRMAELRGGQMISVPLAEGIENWLVEYGFDTTDPVNPAASAEANPGTPDIFRTSLSGAAGARDNDWANVVAVRFHLLARTTEKSAGYTDIAKTYVLGTAGNAVSIAGDNSGFKRRVYSSTVRLSNVAGLREAALPPALAASGAGS